MMNQGLAPVRSDVGAAVIGPQLCLEEASNIHRRKTYLQQISAYAFACRPHITQAMLLAMNNKSPALRRRLLVEATNHDAATVMATAPHPTVHKSARANIQYID